MPGSWLFHCLAPVYHNVVVFVRMRTYICTWYIPKNGNSIILWYIIWEKEGVAYLLVFWSTSIRFVILPGIV